MKKFPAIAVIEFDSIPAGIYLSDIMAKESPISLFKSGTISHGRYLTIIGGTTASVEVALEEAKYADKKKVANFVFLPDIHPQLEQAILGKRIDPGKDAVAIIETTRVPCIIRAAEMILKSTEVDLLEIRLADSTLHGKAMSLFHGTLHDIEEAMEISGHYLQQVDAEHAHFILSAPHETTLQQIKQTTRFHEGDCLELDGEM